jgi:ParB family transcriptional regulator, chromosome partitioning protein
MRHDSHYVDELAGQSPTAIGRLIGIEQLEPNPEQPRVEIGDLSELISSVRERGVLEPLLVKPSAIKGRWMIIAGERRWRAATAAGLREVPCIEMDVDDEVVAEIALIENMQRKDLTPWEEADGLAALCHRFGYTHEDVAKKIGKSRSTVTEALALATIPDDIREECRRADINVKSMLLQVVRQPDEEAMRHLIKEIAGKGLKRDEVRAARRSRTSLEIEGGAESAGSDRAEIRPFKPYIFRYDLPEANAKLELRFEKGSPAREELVAALKVILAALEEG